MAAAPIRTLVTPRCTLEPLLATHAPALFEVLADPAIYEFENEPPPSVAWLAERYRRLESRRSPDGREAWLNWAVRLADGALAGYVQATVRADGTALVAYELGSRHWRQGLGSSAVGAMLDELQQSHRVHTFLAVLKSANFRSMALLRHLGFTPATPAQVQAYGPMADESMMSRAARPA